MSTPSTFLPALQTPVGYTPQPAQQHIQTRSYNERFKMEKRHEVSLNEQLHTPLQQTFC